MWKVLVVILTASAISGCAIVEPFGRAMKPGSRLAKGIDPDLEKNRLESLKKNQDAVLPHLKSLAGVAGATPTPADWQSIVKAGWAAIDRECHKYMGQLHRFDRQKKEVGDQLNLITASTAAAQKILEESARTIANTAVGLGLLEGLWSNASSSILYELDPAAIDGLVAEMRTAYLDKFELTTAVVDRPTAFTAIRNYGELCTPIKIEKEVSAAVRTAKVTASVPNNNKANVRVQVAQQAVPTPPQKQEQSIVFQQPAPQPFGGGAFQITILATSGLQVALLAQTPSVCTVTGTTVTPVARGTCRLIAAQDGNSSYEPADLERIQVTIY